MHKMKSKVLSFVLTLTCVAGLLPAIAFAKDESINVNEYTIQVGETIDLYGKTGLSDWASDNSACVSVDGTSTISPDFVTVTGVAPTAEGEYVAVRHSYSVRVGDTWSDEREEDVFWVVVTDDFSKALPGAINLAVGESIVLSAREGFSDWGSEDSSIAKLDGTETADGSINISPDRTTVTGVTTGTVDVVRSYFTTENGQMTQKEEIFRINVVDDAAVENDNAYTIKVGETIDLTASFGFSDWESGDTDIVRVDGTESISPDSVTAIGVSLGVVPVTRSYFVIENGQWTPQEEVFDVAVVSDINDAPEGTIPVLVGQSVTLSASKGFSDWASDDSSIASLDGTVTAAGFTNISPDQTTVTGVKPGTVDIVRSYFVEEDGLWEVQEEVFHIIVVE
jgi:peptidyl-tRNA hydrolase